MARLFSAPTILFAGFAAGLFSAVQALSAQGLKPVAGHEDWQVWQGASASRWSFYSLQAFLNGGQLPPPKSTQYYRRGTDDDGNGLRGDCTYKISGPATSARWWSLKAENETAVASLSAGQALTTTDGQIVVNISAGPQGDNWLKPPQGNYTLVFVVNDAPYTGQKVALPSVKKLGC